MYFRKRVKHFLTYKIGEKKSQSDHSILNKRGWKQYKKCKIISGENYTTKHRSKVLEIGYKVKMYIEKRISTNYSLVRLTNCWAWEWIYKCISVDLLCNIIYLFIYKENDRL